MELSNWLSTSYNISVFIILISTLLSALELSFVPKHYFNFIYPKIDSVKLENRRKWLFIHTVQIFMVLLSGFALFFSFMILFKSAFLLLTIITYYSYIKRTVSKDGADQLRMLSLLSFSLCFLLSEQYSMLIPLGFIGLQVLLGYLTSGVVKLLSLYWRKGDVLHLIFGTYSYGIPQIANEIKKRPKLERFMAHSAIMVMLFVPISFFIPSQYAIIFSLGSIFLFHFATAIIMGLNDFLYTFPLAYPGIIILHGLFHNYIVF